MAAAAAPGESKGTGVVPSIVNLSKNIVGSGVLSLAFGVAALSGQKLALIPALVILFFLGGVSAYSFSIIARVGDDVGEETYRNTFAKLFGERTGLIPDVVVVIMCMCAALSYAIIIGDTFSSVATLAGAPAILCQPNPWIVIFSATVLLPLCLLRDLGALAIGSVIGTSGTLYTALFMALRFFDGSYRVGGKYHAALAPGLKPAFDASRPILSPSIFVLVSMLATAYLAHYNAPKMYNELAPPEDGSSKLPRFNFVVGAAFAMAATLCGSIMGLGFLTFGASSQGLILNNYATSDFLALIARLGIGLSIIFSYPLNFSGLRDGVLSLLGMKEAGAKKSVHIVSTLVILCSMNGLALFLKDLGLIASVSGAILGSALIYVLPAAMFIKNAAGKKAMSTLAKYELIGNWALGILGIFLGGVGTVMSLKSAGVI